MNAPCDCCTSVNQYIAQHLDPDGLTQPDENAAEVFALFQACFPSEDLGITEEDVAEYIASLSGKETDR
jgi:hypothetical protein